MPAEAELPEIPVYDVGRDFPIELARRVGVRGYDLLERATARTPRPVLGLLDHLSRRWLVRNGSRYLAELDALAVLSQAPGLYYLNVQYEWGCTTAIKPTLRDTRPVSCARSTGTLLASDDLLSPHALPIP
jgi:hypothetical protein